MIRLTTMAMVIALGTLQPVTAIQSGAGGHTRAIPSLATTFDNAGTVRERMARAKWPAFITQFRATVRKRDRRELRSMMVTSFEVALGDVDVPEDTRDLALQFLNKFGGKGWRQLEQVQRHGTRFVRGYTSVDGFDPHRMAPPWADEDGYGGFVSVFAFGPDNEWHWMGFFQWDC